MVPALIVVGVLVLGVAGFALWFFKIRDPLKGVDFSKKWDAEQKWAWQLTLTPEQEQAFMAGLEAYDDERGCYLKRADGILKVYRPMMLISLFALTEGFAAMGPAAMQDPARAVHDLIMRYADGEIDGVIYYDDDWMGEDVDEIDGMDKYEFSSAMLSATHAQGVDHEFAGGYADEDDGYLTMGVLTRNPEHVARMYEEANALSGPPVEYRNKLDVLKDVMRDLDPEYEDAFDRAEVEKSKYINTLIFCYQRVANRYRETRPEMQYAEPKDVRSVVMARMVEEDLSGCTWTRPPSDEQRSLALSLLSNRS